MPTDVNTLKSIDLFKELDPDELAKMAAMMHPMNVTEGEILTRINDMAHTFFVALKGNFLISFKEDRGITLHKRGDIMGWSTVVTPFRYTGTTVALTDGEVLTMAAQDFQDLLMEYSVLSNKIMMKINKIVAERMPYILGTKKNS